MITISAFRIPHATGQIFRTDSPFDGDNCGLCHTGGTSTPTLTIKANPAFGTNNTYTEGQTYTISVNCSGSYPKYGFDIEILNSDSTVAADAGTFGNVVTANCKIVANVGKPTNVVQTAATGTSNAATFTFTWTAPSSGKVYLYCSCLGANNNTLQTGDKVQTTSLILTPRATEVTSLKENELNLNIFPNPTSSCTGIDYTLTSNTEVNIELYDITGRKAGEILKENQNEGKHHLEINLPNLDLKSGIYSVIIIAGEKRSIQRLIIM